MAEPTTSTTTMGARPASSPVASALRVGAGVAAAGTFAATISDNLVPIVGYFIAGFTPDAIEPNVMAIVGAGVPILVTTAGAMLLSFLGSASRDAAHAPGPTPAVVQVAGKLL